MSGKISKSLIDASRRPGFDLDKEYEKEVKKGNYGDGDIIQTTSGRLPCGAIYHLKIETQWQESTGRPVLHTLNFNSALICDDKIVWLAKLSEKVYLSFFRICSAIL